MKINIAGLFVFCGCCIIKVDAVDQCNTMEDAPLMYYGAGETQNYMFVGSGSVVLEDFDGDGDLDVFVVAIDIVYYENDGTQFIARPEVKPFHEAIKGGEFIDYRLNFIDIDCDGDNDVFLTQSYSGPVVIGDDPNKDKILLFENVEGEYVLNFSEKNPFANKTYPNIVNLITYDSDGDGKKDEIYVGNGAKYNCFKIIRESCQIFGVVDSDNFLASLNVDQIFGYSRNLVQMNDFDGDGKRDVFVGAALLEKFPDGTFGIATNQPFGFSNSQQVGFRNGFAIGDIKKANRQDALVLSNKDSLLFFENSNNGSFSAKLPTMNPKLQEIPREDLFFGEISFFDFNQDGKEDIFVTTESTITYYILKTDGKYEKAPDQDQPFASLNFDTTTYKLTGKVQFFDTNGDGKVEAVVQYTSKITVGESIISYLTNVNNKYSMDNKQNTDYLEKLPRSGDRIYIVDIDQDNKMDVVYLVNSMGDFSLAPQTVLITYDALLNQTNPGFGNPLENAFLTSPRVHFFDLDGDGQPEIITPSYNSRGVRIRKYNVDKKKYEYSKQNNPFYGLSAPIKAVALSKDFENGMEFIATGGKYKSGETVYTDHEPFSKKIFVQPCSASPTASPVAPTDGPQPTRRPTAVPTLSPTKSPVVGEGGTKAPSDDSGNDSITIIPSLFILIVCFLIF